MDENNLKVQASASEEIIAKTLKEHKDHYNQWLKKITEPTIDDDSPNSTDPTEPDTSVLQT